MPDSAKFCPKCGAPAVSSPAPSPSPSPAPAPTHRPAPLKADRKASKSASGFSTVDKVLLVILVILLGISAWKYPGFLRKKTDGETSQNTPVINVPKDAETLSDVPEGLEWPFHSAAVDFEAAKGVHVSAEAGNLYDDTVITVSPVEADNATVLDLAEEMYQENIYALAAWEVNAGLDDNEVLPGEYRVDLDLEELEIPEELYENLTVYRVSDSGDRTEYDCTLKGNTLTYATEKNCLSILAVVGLCAVGVTAVFLGAGTVREKWEKNVYFALSKTSEAHGKSDYGSYSVYWRMRDVAPRTLDTMEQMEVIQKKLEAEAKEDYDTYEKFRQDESALYRVFNWNTSVAQRLKEKLAADQEYQRLAKLLEVPASVQYICSFIETAMEYIVKHEHIRKPGDTVQYLIMNKESKNFGEAVGSLFIDSYVNLYLNDPQTFLKDGTEGKTMRDNMLLTITHETFHICQERYRLSIAQDDNRFDEMVTLVLESDAKDYYKEQKIITTDPELTAADFYITLAYPIDKFFIKGDEFTQEEGYTLSTFVQYLRKETGKKVSPVRLMMSRSYLLKAGTSEPLITAFKMSQKEFDQYWRKFCLSHLKDFSNSYLTHMTNDKYKPYQYESQPVTANSKVHVSFQSPESYHAGIRNIYHPGRQEMALLVVLDEKVSEKRPDAQILPCEKYVMTNSGAYVPLLKSISAKDRPRLMLEIYGDSTGVAASDAGYTVYGLGAPDQPKLEADAEKLYITLPDAVNAMKDGVLDGLEIRFECSDGTTKTSTVGLEKYGKKFGIPLNSLTAEKTNGSVKFTVTMKEYVIGKDQKRYYGAETKPVTIGADMKQPEVTPEPTPTPKETEVPQEPIVETGRSFSNLPIVFDGLVSFDEDDRKPNPYEAYGNHSQMSPQPRGDHITVNGDTISVEISPLSWENHIWSDYRDYYRSVSRTGFSLKGTILTQSDNHIEAYFTELPRQITGIDEERTVLKDGGDTSSGKERITIEPTAGTIEIDLADGKVTKVLLTLKGAGEKENTNVNYEGQSETHTTDWEGGFSIRMEQ